MIVLLLAWLASAFLLALSVSQWVGFDGWRTLAVLQALTPFALACAVPLGLGALASGEWVLAATTLPALATLAWLLLAARGAGRAPATGPVALRVAFGNLLADNPQPDAVMAAMAATDADVLVLLEFTPPMAAALEHRCGAHYPHRLEHVEPHPGGIALWSRLPFDSTASRRLGAGDRPLLDVHLTVQGTAMRIVAVHTEPPTMRARNWIRELREIADVTDRQVHGPMPTLLLGDFNASRWHPSFRRLLAHGWTSAHEWLGHWWRGSWPTAGTPAPVFVRLDHALLRDGVEPVSVAELPLPGSDHRGFVVGLGLATR